VHQDADTGEERILGVSRVVKLHGTQDADFSIIVSDAFQGHGLGAALLTRLAEVSRAEKVQRLTGIVHPENRGMLRLCARLGFEADKQQGEEVEVALTL
jgi:acetyltransferase